MIVKLPAVPVIEQPVAVTTPELAVKSSPLMPVPPQLSVPVPEARDKVTASELFVSVWLEGFSTATTGWGFRVAPLTALVVPGWVVKANLVDTPTVKVFEVALV